MSSIAVNDSKDFRSTGGWYASNVDTRVDSILVLEHFFGQKKADEACKRVSLRQPSFGSSRVTTCLKCPTRPGRTSTQLHLILQYIINMVNYNKGAING